MEDIELTPKSSAQNKSKLLRQIQDEKDNGQTTVVAANSFSSIKIELLDDNPFQPRLSLNQDTLYELAMSIKENTLIQPIGVKKNGNRYTIAYGHRRVAAHKLLGLKSIKANIDESVSNKQLRTIALIENIQRDSMHPIELALSLSQSLHNKEYKNQTELGNALGKDTAWTTKMIKMLTMPQVVLDDLMENKSISDTTMLDIIRRAGEPEVVSSVYNWCVENNASRQMLKEKIESLRNEAQNTPKSYTLKTTKTKHSINIDRKKLSEEDDKKVGSLIKELEALLS